MSELTDDQLDGLFKKSAEEFEPQFDPTAWQDMKTRLDRHERTRPGGAINWKNWLPWGIPILLLLPLVGGLWYINQEPNATNQPAALAHKPAKASTQGKAIRGSQQPERSRSTAANPPTSPTSHSTEPEDDNLELAPRTRSVGERNTPRQTANKADTDTRPAAAAPAERATKLGTTTYPSGNKTNFTTHTNQVAKRVKAIGTERTVVHLHKSTALVSSVSRRKPQRREEATPPFSKPAHAITITPSFTSRRAEKQPRTAVWTTANAEAKEPISGATSDVSSSNRAINELAIRAPRWPRPLTFVERPVVSAPDTVTPRPTPSPVVSRGLSIRLAVAPDLSTVGLTNFSRPGTNIGLLVEYRLAPRWSVQAGVVRSTKIYDAVAGQYGYWPDYITKWSVKPTGVEGMCTIIDIPLNVRYDAIIKPQLANKPPSRWFVSAGVTSYVMKQEEYTFKYSDYTHVYPNMIGESANTGGYGLSHVNLSLGYERAINRRLSWQIEPFMKVPLKGVGYFKIDLISTGTFFSIRYKL